ncbi:MAG: hypothetical protein FWC71_09015 [Defluviitaleaceae bacterium]|nr:hypothetical protein [Defluviitaleaceae bacterium]
MDIKGFLKEVASAVLDTGLIAANAYFAAKPLQNAVENFNRENAILILKEYVGKYKNQINLSNPITGMYTFDVSDDYFDDKSDDYIKRQLWTLINFIRTIEVVKEGSKTIVEKTYDLLTEDDERSGYNNACKH